MAIKDPRGKCRSRLAGDITRKMRGRIADVPRPFKNWDKIGSWRERGREVRQTKLRTRTFYVRCRRQFMDAVSCAD
jgi:hypothetical protein